MKENLKTNFIDGELELVYNSKERLDEAYREIVDNTTLIPADKSTTLIDTSNVLTVRNIEIGDLLEGESKDSYKKLSDNPNYEEADYTYLVPWKPWQSSDSEVCDYTNTHTCIAAIIPDNPVQVEEEFGEVNYLTKDRAIEIIKESGYVHLPLDKNAAQGFLSTKVGIGKSINSILEIPDGKLKRELSDITIALSGANIEHNDGGFFKVVYGQGAAYLTNYKDLHGDRATDMLLEHFRKLGYDDVGCTYGCLQKYYYTAVFESKKLGEEVLSKSKIDATNPVAKILFKTSDYGLSSLNMTPYLEMEIESGKFRAPRRVIMNLSDMVNLNHSAALNEEESITMESLWSKKCEELFAVVKETADRLMNADKVAIRYPKNAMNNLLSSIGATANFSGKEEIIEEFVEDFGTDCTARDLYVYAFAAILVWEQTNQTATIRAKEKLTRVLVSNSWGKYDTI